MKTNFAVTKFCCFLLVFVQETSAFGTRLKHFPLSATSFDAIYSPTDVFESLTRRQKDTFFFRKHHIKDVGNVILRHERSGDVVSGIMLAFLSPSLLVFSRAVVKPFDGG